MILQKIHKFLPSHQLDIMEQLLDLLSNPIAQIKLPSIKSLVGSFFRASHSPNRITFSLVHRHSQYTKCNREGRNSFPKHLPRFQKMLQWKLSVSTINIRHLTLDIVRGLDSHRPFSVSCVCVKFIPKGELWIQTAIHYVSLELQDKNSGNGERGGVAVRFEKIIKKI